MTETLIQKLTSPAKWVYLMENNNYRVSNAPQEAALRIAELENTLEYIMASSSDLQARDLAQVALTGVAENESDIQSNNSEPSGTYVSFFKAG